MSRIRHVTRRSPDRLPPADLVSPSNMKRTLVLWCLLLGLALPCAMQPVPAQVRVPRPREARDRMHHRTVHCSPSRAARLRALCVRALVLVVACLACAR